MTDQTPVLLITRPAPEAAQLVQALGTACPTDHAVLISPLIAIDPVATRYRTADFAGVIFTSVNAVRQIEGQQTTPGQTAFCVGDKTAEAARQIGFDAVSAGGAADDLISLILSYPARGPLIHLRGAHTRGDIAEKLSMSGYDVTSAVVYEQRPLSLNQPAMQALQGTVPICLPIYSPNTAKALLNQAPFNAPLHIIAISDAVADVAQKLDPARIVIATRPDGPAMVAAICAALGGKSDLSGP